MTDEPPQRTAGSGFLGSGSMAGCLPGSCPGACGSARDEGSVRRGPEESTEGQKFESCWLGVRPGQGESVPGGGCVSIILALLVSV